MGDVYKTGDSDDPAHMRACLRLVIVIPSCPSAVRFLQSAQQSSRDATAAGMWKGGKRKAAEIFLKRDCDKHGVRVMYDYRSMQTRGDMVKAVDS